MLGRDRMKGDALGARRNAMETKNVSTEEEFIPKEVKIRTCTLENQTRIEGKASEILSERKNIKAHHLTKSTLVRKKRRGHRI